MNEERREDWVEDELRHARRGIPATDAPAFAKTFEAAEAQLDAERRRLYTSGAIAAVLALVAIGIALRMPGPATPDGAYRIGDALMTSTQWTAPSDALMPRHQFDIYQDLPTLPGSTESAQGTLL